MGYGPATIMKTEYYYILAFIAVILIYWYVSSGSSNLNRLENGDLQ